MKIGLKVDQKSMLDFVMLIYISSLFGLYGKFRPAVEIISLLALLILEFLNKKNLKLYVNYYFIWGILFLFFNAISILWGANRTAILYGTRGILENFLAGIILIVILFNEEKQIWVLKCMIYSALLLFCKIIINVPLQVIMTRQYSNIINANLFGMKEAFAFVIILWFFLERYISKKFFITLASVFCLATMLSGSKKALVIIILGTIMLFIQYQKTPLKLLYCICLSVIVVYGLYWLLLNNTCLYQAIGHRVKGMLEILSNKNQADASTRERAYLMETAIKYWRKRPLLGYGTNTFGAVVQYSKYGRVNVYSHCNYTELLFGLGIIGLIIYYQFYVCIGINLLKKYQFSSINKLKIVFILLNLVIDIALVSYGDEFIQFLNVFISCTWLQKLDIRRVLYQFVEHGSVNVKTSKKLKLSLNIELEDMINKD